MKDAAVVFPGQGSQYIGMGRALYDRYDYVKDLYTRADDVLHFSLSRLCFNGPDEELRQTFNTQPALLLTSYSAWLVVKNETGLVPRSFAGHSLGEYTALLAAGFFSFDDALLITRKRGLLMEQACPKGKGGMVALVGAVMDKVEPVLREISHDDYVVVPANLNSQEQVVLSGDAEALKEAVEELKGVGYKKAVFLNVSGPFHSPLMRPAAEKLKEELDRLVTGPLHTPVVCNVDAAVETRSEAVRDKLYRQMFSPVRWEESVKTMVSEGAAGFLEVGPQKVLSNLIKRIEPAFPVANIETIEQIEPLKSEYI